MFPPGTVLRSPQGFIAVRMGEEIKAAPWFLVDPNAGGWWVRGTAQIADIETWEPLESTGSL